MKIIATVSDCGAAAHIGGEVEKRSVIIDLGENLPALLRQYLDNRERVKGKTNSYTYQDLSFSILDDAK